jgi:hypothetical protein
LIARENGRGGTFTLVNNEVDADKREIHETTENTEITERRTRKSGNVIDDVGLNRHI